MVAHSFTPNSDPSNKTADDNCRALCREYGATALVFFLLLLLLLLFLLPLFLQSRPSQPSAVTPLCLLLMLSSNPLYIHLPSLCPLLFGLIREYR